MVEDENQILHYFHHVIVQDILNFDAKQNTNKNENNILKKVVYANYFLEKDITFETPFVKKSKSFQPKVTKGGENWNNLFRLNNKDNSYAYIRNTFNDYLSVNDITSYYDQINIPETAIINKLRLKIKGISSPTNRIQVNNCLNTNYITDDVSGNKIQLIPNKIECYSHLKESSIFYEEKLNIATEKEQESFIKYYKDLLEENYIFNEDIDVDVSDYLQEPNDFIEIDNEFWYEISEFTDLTYKLNEVSSINLVIEGYNTEYETTLLAEVLSETDHSSTVKKTIPSGYFRKKIDLLYANEYLLELLRVRFRFKRLTHNIKIFDTKLEINFKNKQQHDILFENGSEIDINKNNIVTLLENYYNPSDINNGLTIQFVFDDLKPGDYYHINSTELEVIYTETDIDIMLNKNKYQDSYYGVNKSGISGIAENTYLSGLFYDDLPTMMQDEDNIGIDNKGIKLQNALYQLFETRDDNITSIEIFPYGFIGNPDETLKIGLYTNSFNTPGSLIKEVIVSGWVKNNKDLKNLGRIKYNFNINGLDINEKYWFKIQVLNQQENSYYLLKGINNTKPGFKLLADENNNYINTFSNLKFNIYSKNLSTSFNSLPVLQENFDNPYIIIGLHKGIGTIRQLQTNKYIKSVSGNDYMSEVFENQPNMKVFSIKVKDVQTNEEEELLEGE